jgi:protein-tyrosine-phosphatase
MAEAYLNSLHIQDCQAISSGIDALYNKHSIAWDTKVVLKNHRIYDFTSKMWQQITREMIKESDTIVFMEEVHRDYCINRLGVTLPKYEIWNIKDTDINKQQEEVLKESEETFKTIVSKVDELVCRLNTKQD